MKVHICVLAIFIVIVALLGGVVAEEEQQENGLKTLDQMPGPTPDWIDKWFFKGNNDPHFIHFTSIEPYLEYAKQYGDLVHFKLSGRGDFCLLTNADWCHEIFETPEFASRTIDPYISSTYGAAAGLDDQYFYALSNDNSDYWKIKRQFVNTFIQPTYPSYIDYFNNRSKDLVAQLKEAGNGQKKFDIQPYSLFRRWVFEMIGEVMFGKEDFNRDLEGKEKFYAAVEYWLDHFVYFEPFSYPYHNMFSWLMAQPLYSEMKNSYYFLSNMIQYKRQNNSFGNDWMSLLAQAEIDGRRLSDLDIMLMCLDMMDGCVGPTPFLLDYGIHSLAKFGFVQEKARLEHKKVMGERTDITAADLHNMPYLRGTAMEMLRIYPSGGGINVRTNNQPNVTFHGYIIPQDTTFVLNVYALHMSKKYWTEPANVDPLRWDPSVPKTEWAFQTFGGGVKGCPGKDFMVLFTNVVFSHLIQNFDMLEEYGEPTVLFKLVARTEDPLTHHLQIRN